VGGLSKVGDSVLVLKTFDVTIGAFEFELLHRLGSTGEVDMRVEINWSITYCKGEVITLSTSPPRPHPENRSNLTARLARHVNAKKATTPSNQSAPIQKRICLWSVCSNKEPSASRRYCSAQALETD